MAAKKVRAVKMKVLPVQKGDRSKTMSLEYKGVPVQNAYVREDSEGRKRDGKKLYAIIVGDGHVDEIMFNQKKQGMELRKEKDGSMSLSVEGLRLEYDNFPYSEEQIEARKGEVLRKYRPRYETYFIIHDNGHPTFSGWYKESHCRETAFSDAIWYLNMRIVSGLPTKKPYIITVNEHKHSKSGKIKDGRKWDIKLEITKR